MTTNPTHTVYVLIAETADTSKLIGVYADRRLAEHAQRKLFGASDEDKVYVRTIVHQRQLQGSFEPEVRDILDSLDKLSREKLP